MSPRKRGDMFAPALTIVFALAFLLAGVIGLALTGDLNWFTQRAG